MPRAFLGLYAFVMFAAQVQACTRCDLHKTCRLPVPGIGPLRARVVVIGQSPGGREDEENRPFVPDAPSGRELRQSLVDIGLDPVADVYYTNAVKCHPPGNRKAHVGEADACRPWLDAELALWQGGLIVAVGEDSARALFPTKRGTKNPTLSDLRNSNELEYDGRPVRVVLHPASLLRPGGERLRADYDQDWERIGLFLGTVEPRVPYWKHYRYARSGAELGDAWTALGLESAGIIGLDTEFGWPEDARDPIPPIAIGYSVSTAVGNALWVPSYVDGFRDTLRSLTDGSRIIVLHSVQADVPVIQRALSMPLSAWPWARTFDTAIAAYVRREPAIGLKPLALSHFRIKLSKFSETFGSPEQFATLSIEEQYAYAGADADIARRLAMGPYWEEFSDYLHLTGAARDGV